MLQKVLSIKSSHRTWPEQAVGCAIFFLISFAFQIFTGWLVENSSQTHQLFSLHWVPIWISYHFLIAFSMWNLWRRHSLAMLKLELSVFFSQFILQISWAMSFYIFRETLLALVLLLFLSCNTILAILLYWKKERFSGQALIPPFCWIFYMVIANMAICVSNP